jgi:DNA-binding transcriptional MerR regulator
MPATTQPRIERALEILDSETTLATDERAAFRRFRARLATIDPVAPATPSSVGSGGGTMTLGGGDPAPSEGIRAVRTAYRETVMATPHFEREYDESLRENVAAELGAEVAAQVADGARLTPVLYEALEQGSEQATLERTEFLRVLERERESLREIRDALDDCESEAHALSEAVTDAADSAELGRIDDRLAALERECADLAERRQACLHGRTVGSFSGVDADSLVDFLYEECETTCPGLAAITDCLSSIRAIRQRCLR